VGDKGMEVENRKECRVGGGAMVGGIGIGV